MTRPKPWERVPLPGWPDEFEDDDEEKRFDPNQPRDSHGRWRDVIPGDEGLQSGVTVGPPIMATIDFSAIGGLEQPKLDWPDGVESIPFDDADDEQVQREIAEGKRDEHGDLKDDTSSPFLAQPNQADIGRNLEHYRREFAGEARKTEILAGKLLGVEGRSNWSGNVEMDSDQLALADGVKTWDCDIVMLSSWAVGHSREKRHYTLFHEMLHAYTQRFSVEQGVDLGRQKQLLRGGHRYLEEGVVDGTTRVYLEDYMKGIGRSHLYEEVREQYDSRGKSYASGYEAWVRDLDVFASMVNVPARKFYTDLVKLPNGEPRKQYLRDAVEKARKTNRNEAPRWGYDQQRADAEHVSWRNYRRRTVVTEAERKSLLVWIDSAVWDPPSELDPHRSHEPQPGQLAQGRLPWQVSGTERTRHDEERAGNEVTRSNFWDT